MTASTVLTIFVLILLIIDLIYRIRVPHVVQDPSSSKKDSVLKEFFRDHKDQLSFTRLSTAVVLLFGFSVVIYGLYHPQLWEQCKSIWEKVCELAKLLFGIGKVPEAVGQLQGILGTKTTGEDK